MSFFCHISTLFIFHIAFPLVLYSENQKAEEMLKINGERSKPSKKSSNNKEIMLLLTKQLFVHNYIVCDQKGKSWMLQPIVTVYLIELCLIYFSYIFMKLVWVKD